MPVNAASVLLREATKGFACNVRGTLAATGHLFWDFLALHLRAAVTSNEYNTHSLLRSSECQIAAAAKVLLSTSLWHMSGSECSTPI